MFFASRAGIIGVVTMAMKIQRSRMLTRRKVWMLIVVAVLLAASALVYVWQTEAPSASETNTTQVTVEAPQDSEAALATITPQVPVRLKIASIGVDAPIIPVGTEPDGAMAAPKTATDIGWYEKSAKLGSSRRAMLLSGHYGLDTPEVLRRLSELKVGDRLVVEGAEGDALTFEVAETERKHRTEVDMEKAFRYGGGQEAVSIITCIGMYNYAEKTYNDRYVVYALRVK